MLLGKMISITKMVIRSLNLLAIHNYSCSMRQLSPVVVLERKASIVLQ